MAPVVGQELTGGTEVTSSWAVRVQSTDPLVIVLGDGCSWAVDVNAKQPHARSSPSGQPGELSGSSAASSSSERVEVD